MPAQAVVVSDACCSAGGNPLAGQLSLEKERADRLKAELDVSCDGCAYARTPASNRLFLQSVELMNSPPLPTPRERRVMKT